MKTKHLDQTQIQALKAHFLSSPSPVNLLLELLMKTGCRTDELCRIEFGHVDVEHETVTIHAGSKGSNARSAPVPKYLCIRLKAVMLTEGLNLSSRLVELVSKSSVGAQKRALQRDWERLRFRLFGQGCVLGLHCFRHTFAKAIYTDSRKDLLATQLGLGHKSLNSTQHYLQHITYDEHRSLYKNAV